MVLTAVVHGRFGLGGKQTQKKGGGASILVVQKG